MAEDEGKKEEEKFDFTPEGESLGYISLDQARVLAMSTARDAPGDYGGVFQGASMAFAVTEAEETEDYYVISLSFRPQGRFSGTRGQEQFFIEKEGTVAHRQVLDLPRPERRIPVIPVAIGLAVVGVVATLRHIGHNPAFHRAQLLVAKVVPEGLLQLGLLTNQVAQIIADEAVKPVVHLYL